MAGKPADGPHAPAPGDEAARHAAGHDIVVVGASAGGMEALQALLRGIPADIPAALFIVSHILPESGSYLVDALNDVGPLPARHPEDGEEISHGMVYVAPPDRHLLVTPGRIRISAGPRENRWRPAIDPLFRSAAVAYATRVIGAVLTGMLDDGTAGLMAVKRCGGIAIVQDPEHAAYPDMPQSALANVDVDYKATLAEIGGLIARLAHEPAPRRRPAPKDLEREVAIAETGYSDVRISNELGRPSMYGCPECGGPLWQRPQDGSASFRCHVGHAYGFHSLLAASDDTLETTLWAAVRLFEQRANILTTLAEKDRSARQARMTELHSRLAREARAHAQALREFIMKREAPAGDAVAQQPGRSR